MEGTQSQATAGQGPWAIPEAGRGTGQFLPQSSQEEPTPEHLDFRVLASNTVRVLLSAAKKKMAEISIILGLKS